jgi:hypothetical protein
MKRNKTKIIFLVVLVVGVAAVAFFVSKKSEAPTITDIKVENAPTNQPEVSNNETASADIVVTNPINNQVLSSGTLEVSGTARGSWYFEGTAPFEIEDNNKNVIETSAVKAQGEWTTTNFVPFSGEITFTVPQGIKNGFVLFHNDNPSGDPSNDKSVSVPVTFK